jgi:hypothetical protein
MHPRTRFLLPVSFALVSYLSACSGDTPQSRQNGGSGGGVSITTTNGSVGPGPGAGGAIIGSGAGGSSGNQSNEEPATCDQAAAARAYVGCDFWPTIVANPVYVDFDPAVVVANGGMNPAKVTVDGPSAFHQEVTVAPGALQTILLKWVLDLKGPEFSVTNTSGGRLDHSVRVNQGAYHMVSDVPVTAWVYNPIEYTKPCHAQPNGSDCRSASNDASLLLPTTAMTPNYRVFSYSSRQDGSAATSFSSVPSGVAITATQDGTSVAMQFGKDCGAETNNPPMMDPCLAAGPGIASKNSGEIYDFDMNAGDVIELVGQWGANYGLKNGDLSGSVIQATKAVQVIAFNAIANMPDSTVANSDHLEETVLPAEVIGKKYIVVPPTAPNGSSVGHVVRIYGDFDNTHLTYSPAAPPGAPMTINAGETAQLPYYPAAGGTGCYMAADHCMTNVPFVVEGDQPFAVASFMVGGFLQNMNSDYDGLGDPSMTIEVTPEQFRNSYTFLAPTDYVKNFADVLVPDGASVTLDGQTVSSTPTAIGASGWGYLRLPLGAGNGGVHKISTDQGKTLGLQIAGFGNATSYSTPGGLNLKLISNPPPIVR